MISVRSGTIKSQRLTIGSSSVDVQVFGAVPPLILDTLDKQAERIGAALENAPPKGGTGFKRRPQISPRHRNEVRKSLGQVK